MEKKYSNGRLKLETISVSLSKRFCLKENTVELLLKDSPIVFQTCGPQNFMLSFP